MKITTELFISKAKSIHNNRYTYEKTEYVSTREKVLITCKTHGDFLQTPHGHLNGQGCPKCAWEQRGKQHALTTEEFVSKSKAIHGDRFDYSKSVYTTYNKKIEIICSIHGSFWQVTGEHLSGRICRHCAAAENGVKNSLNLNEFVEKATALHNGHYDYSKSVYVNSQTKLIIGCPIHGDFEQVPNSHLNGQGCPVCGGRLQSNTEDFITKAKAVHGDIYDYSKVNYTKAKEKVTITCRTHGDFDQQPNNHLTGHGCPFCMKRVIVDTEEFIRRAKAVHGDTYDYSKAKFVDGKTYVTIGCKIHGDFGQAASEHIRGRGCDKCGGSFDLTTEDFINKAKTVHGDLYDYSQSFYDNAKTKIKIICKKHGCFLQLPHNHLKGTGCPTCKSSKGELAIAKILNKHNIPYVQEYIIPNQRYAFRYDFYLPNYNLFIEYHGLQHYKPIEFFGGREAFLELKIRDDMKKTLAKSLGYKFEEVKYTALLNLSEEEFEKRLLFNIFKYSAL